MRRIGRILSLCAFSLCFATLGSGQTTLEMKEQAGAELQKADEALNKVYGELRVKLSGAKQAELKQVQLAWLKYRDLAADFEAGAYEGGSMMGVIKLNVLTVLTEQRTEQLKHCFVEGYEATEETGPEPGQE
jgi:uncharacterized protein YecT (DUF1311 family)